MLRLWKGPGINNNIYNSLSSLSLLPKLVWENQQDNSLIKLIFNVQD